jgi:hypothetical protein
MSVPSILLLYSLDQAYDQSYPPIPYSLASLPRNQVKVTKMGGGGGKPQNIFKLNRGDDPKEVLNWRLWFAVVSFGIMGAARGIDEGLISGTLSKDHFVHLLGLDKMSETELANVEGNISAMVQIGSVGGAALSVLVDNHMELLPLTIR